MKAAILYEVGQPMVIEDVELDAPRPHEVRIRVAASGLCHSDYHFMIGNIPFPLPAVLGHEASGTIEAVGEDVRGLAPGDAVVTCITGFCGMCDECQTGHNYRCDDKPMRGPAPDEARIKLRGKPVNQFGLLGGFAEEMLVHENSVTKLPHGMKLDVAALLGCAVLTGVGAVLNQAKVRPGEIVAVIGCGGVGLNVIQGAKIAGAGRIIAVDINPEKLAMARAFGATHTVSGGENAVAEVLELTGGGVHYGFEVIGLPATIRQAFMMLRKGGAAVVVGVPRHDVDLAFPAMDLLTKEARVITSTVGSISHRIGIPSYAKFYMNGALKLDELISQRIGLADINHGYEQMIAGHVARSVIVFN